MPDKSLVFYPAVPAARLLREKVSENWEDEAPAEPMSWVKPKRLGRSLALPMASFLVFMGFEFPDTLQARSPASERKGTYYLEAVAVVKNVHTCYNDVYAFQRKLAPSR